MVVQKGREHEAVYRILRNPLVLSDGMIDETLYRFKRINPYAGDSFNPRNVHELVRSYLITLWDTLEKEAAKKTREDGSRADFTSP